MALDSNKVIAIARAEVGYLEKKSNSQLDDKTANAGSKNYTKYNRDYNAWGGGGAQPMEWCASFASWCFVKAYGLETAKQLLCGGLHHYTPTGANRFKKKDRYIKRGAGKPKPGDVVYFFSSSKNRIGHVGIVYKVTDSTVYTIEGNTSGASTLVTNGGGVKEKSYKLTSTYIDGYGSVDYGITESETQPPTAETKGGENVKYVKVTGGSVNIRTGDSTGFKKIAVLRKGAKYEYVAQSVSSGWYAIRYEGQIAWISHRYSTVV